MRKFFIGFSVGVFLSAIVAYAVTVNTATGESQLQEAKEGKELQVIVELKNTVGEKIGLATLTEESKGVRITVEAVGLTPGKHGFHVHEKPITGNDLTSAGGHYNPTGKEHGHLNPKGYHLGDLRNLTANQDGTVKEEVFAEGITLQRGHAHSIMGRSLMIHAGEDDEKTDPAGNSGDRVAGGNINP